MREKDSHIAMMLQEETTRMELDCYRYKRLTDQLVVTAMDSSKGMRFLQENSVQRERDYYRKRRFTENEFINRRNNSQVIRLLQAKTIHR